MLDKYPQLHADMRIYLDYFVDHCHRPAHVRNGISFGEVYDAYVEQDGMSKHDFHQLIFGHNAHLFEMAPSEDNSGLRLHFLVKYHRCRQTRSLQSGPDRPRRQSGGRGAQRHRDRAGHAQGRIATRMGRSEYLLIITSMSYS